jgi:hypothetical protein
MKWLGLRTKGNQLGLSRPTLYHDETLHTGSFSDYLTTLVPLQSLHIIDDDYLKIRKQAESGLFEI